MEQPRANRKLISQRHAPPCRGAHPTTLSDNTPSRELEAKLARLYRSET